MKIRKLISLTFWWLRDQLPPTPPRNVRIRMKKYESVYKADHHYIWYLAIHCTKLMNLHNSFYIFMSAYHFSNMHIFRDKIPCCFENAWGMF